MSTALNEASFFLNELARREHRGRGDTWSAARDRAARSAGVPRSYAKRLWDRWQTMNDVSGEAYRNLRSAYERVCERNEAAAAAYQAERLQLETERHALDLERPEKGVGTNAARERAAEREMT